MARQDERLPAAGAHRPLVAALAGHEPQIDASAFLAATCAVLGRVRLGPRASVWYGAVLRAEDDGIVVGAASNLQDGAVLHTDPGFPVVIGAHVTVGHGAVIHGAQVDDDVLVGMRAVVLNGARIGTGSVVAAGAVVRPGEVVPPGSLVAGVPAVVRRPVTPAESATIDSGWRNYVANQDRHRDVGRI